jgi:cupin fold WbuC family metalloprotein
MIELIDDNLLNQLSEKAKRIERLRINYNFHKSLDSKVQRLLNALEPNTILPIHRHKNTDETYILIRGRIEVVFYDQFKNKIDSIILDPRNGSYGINIPAGQWHTVNVIESDSVIFEVKEGPYILTNNDDVIL